MTNDAIHDRAALPARHELLAVVAADGSVATTDAGGTERSFDDMDAVCAYMRERQKAPRWSADVPYVVIIREASR